MRIHAFSFKNGKLPLEGVMGILFFICLIIETVESDLVEAKEVTELLWWQKRIYQIYPRSFKDSDGNGVGDIKGIIQKIPHLVAIGCVGVWIGPIWKSPMVDLGYDISNYREIDPLFGNMADFEDMLHAFHENGLFLIIDIVPNHTSDQHEWFQKSVLREDPYTDYYVWVDPKEDDNNTRKPPNNWLSDFRGSAWEWNENRQQYYYHQFERRQPDLNYRNPRVREEILSGHNVIIKDEDGHLCNFIARSTRLGHERMRSTVFAALLRERKFNQ